MTLPWSSHGWWCHHSPLTCQQRRRKWRQDERWRRWPSQGVARCWTLPQSLRRLHHQQQPKQGINSLQWRQSVIPIKMKDTTEENETRRQFPNKWQLSGWGEAGGGGGKFIRLTPFYDTCQEERQHGRERNEKAVSQWGNCRGWD